MQEANTNLRGSHAKHENRVSDLGGELLGTPREPTSSTQFPVDVPASTAMVLGSDSCAPLYVSTKGDHYETP
jgi:hypothetical protein